MPLDKRRGGFSYGTVLRGRARTLSLEPEDLGELREILVGQASRVASIMVDPDYLALLRTIIADTHRFPQLGEIYRSTVPERGFRIFLTLMERVRERGIVDIPDAEAATRLYFGPLVTYALLAGLFKPGQRPQPPEKIGHIVDMYMRSYFDELFVGRTEQNFRARGAERSVGA